jgi:hypothetical protein
VAQIVCITGPRKSEITALHPSETFVPQGMGGIMYVSGEPDGLLTSVGLPVCDLGTRMIQHRAKLQQKDSVLRGHSRTDEESSTRQDGE